MHTNASIKKKKNLLLSDSIASSLFIFIAEEDFESLTTFATTLLSINFPLFLTELISAYARCSTCVSGYPISGLGFFIFNSFCASICVFVFMPFRTYVFFVFCTFFSLLNIDSSVLSCKYDSPTSVR